MEFNLFWGTTLGETEVVSSILTWNDISLEVGNTPEKVGVECAGLRPLLRLFSNLGVLSSSSYYPCLIQSLSLVAGIIMIYTQRGLCVWSGAGECVCVCVSSKQCTVPSHFVLSNTYLLVRVCVFAGANSCANLHKRVSVTSPSICPPSLKPSVHLVAFWDVSPATV